MSWNRAPKTKYPPADQAWMDDRGNLLIRIRLPELEGQPTGGFWVLYLRRKKVFKLLVWRRFTRDAVRKPPTIWANEWLRRSRFM